MWSSRLFWKLFFSYASLHLAATVTFAVIVAGWQKDQVVDEVKQRLQDSASLVRTMVLDDFDDGRTEALQQRVRRLGALVDTRITLVAMDGEVLADSEQPGIAEVALMENHKTRPELLQAAESGHGMAERGSPTLGIPMLYIAKRADRDGQPAGLVRTAVPMTEVHAHVAAIQRLIWLVALAVSLAVLAFTYFFAVRMVRPVTTLTQAAESIATGDYQQRIYISTQDELGDLGKSFNRMSKQLAAREAQLRESSQRLATVLGGMVEGVIAVDERERIMFANAAAGRLLAFSPAEAEGRPLLEAVRNHRLHQAALDTRASLLPQSVEIEFVDRESRVVVVNSAVLPGDPAPRVVLVMHDVTELRRLEKLRQDFVANVSHELKTPLSSIKAYAETLIQGAINDDQHNTAFVQRIEEQADRLHRLILDMISLARIESKQQTFDMVTIRVSEVVRSCLAEHQAVAEAKGIALSADGEVADLQVKADEEGMRQILDNLIDNAVKYTPAGGQVTLSWRAENANALIEVRDTGIGIGKDHLPRVFERFYRVDKARSRELGGTGLGLSIVKHLVQSFGGSLEVQSMPAKGSVFTVRLPRA